MKKTWWGKRFLEALEQQMDTGRLQRGRSYKGPGRIVEFEIKEKAVIARVKGNINPYFGVFEVPYYSVKLSFKPISQSAWTKAVRCISKRPSMMLKLFMKEMPDNIEECFKHSKTSLLPSRPSDIEGTCSCPDWANPCKHIAGVYFRLGEALDQDPLLLFELRGMDFSHLIASLERSPLGRALAAATLKEREERGPLEPSKHLFPEVRPQKRLKAGAKLDKNLVSFWFGGIDTGGQFGDMARELRRSALKPPIVPALHLKKEGDNPPFWRKDISFLSSIEAVYERIVKQFTK